MKMWRYLLEVRIFGLEGGPLPDVEITLMPPLELGWDDLGPVHPEFRWYELNYAHLENRQGIKADTFADAYSYRQAESRLHRAHSKPTVMNYAIQGAVAMDHIQELLELKRTTVFEIRNLCPEPEGVIFMPDNKYRRRGQRKHWEKFKK